MARAMVGPIRIGIAKAVLQQDLEPTRFEDFCCALISEIEGGRPVLSTSRSWDRGRDGRSVGPGPRVLVCATLDPALGPKSQADLQKIASSGTRADKIYYCTSQVASEHTLDHISAQLSAILQDKVTVETIAGPQLARLSQDFPQAIWRFYSGEIEDCLSALKEDVADGSKDATVLALATACHANSDAVRGAAYETLLVRTLSDGISRTLNECTRDLATTLHLGRSFAALPIEYHLARLLEREAIKLDDDSRYSLTDVGRNELEMEDEAAATELLQGRNIVREYLEDAVNTRFPEDQYARIWNAIQTRLTRFFYEQGHRMIEAVERFGRATPSGHVTGAKPMDLPFFVRDLAAAAAATCVQPDFATGVEQAIVDMFEERFGPAYEWLGRVCSAYVLVCMLGLEAKSGRRIEDAVANTHLILDTDVLLELLGPGEPFHESARQLIDGWRRIGGTVLVATPVVEELAHHAWIASIDYAEARDKFLRTDSERRRFVRNVFVRSFGWQVENEGVRPNSWERYIRVFQGRSDRDVGPITSYLLANYNLKRVPEGDLNLQPGKDVWEQLRSSADRSGATGRELKIRKDKAHRDARLFGSMHRYSLALSEAEGQATCILVTSSGRLREVSNRFGTDDEVSLSLAEALYLLTVVPGVSIGLTAMKSILFDSRLLPRTSDLDLLVLRAIHDSGEFQFPWSRRAAVTRGVRRRLVQIAKERGDSRIMPEQIVQEDNEEARATLTEVIAKSLAAVGAEPRIEQELTAANKRIAELERQLRERR